MFPSFTSARLYHSQMKTIDKLIMKGPWRPFNASSISINANFIIIFLFVVTAAGVVPCGNPKKRPRIPSIVQFIFYVWSFEIGGDILRNQKTLSV